MGYINFQLQNNSFSTIFQERKKMTLPGGKGAQAEAGLLFPGDEKVAFRERIKKDVPRRLVKTGA